jgi:hypothetical protein
MIYKTSGWEPVLRLTWLDRQWDQKLSASLILERRRRAALNVLRVYLVPEPSKTAWMQRIGSYQIARPRSE